MDGSGMRKSREGRTNFDGLFLEAIEFPDGVADWYVGDEMESGINVGLLLPKTLPLRCWDVASLGLLAGFVVQPEVCVEMVKSSFQRRGQ